jgi:hypothetical protein
VSPRPEQNAEKTHSAFALEDQEMARQLDQEGGNWEVMAPPAFASPDPATQGRRLVPIDTDPHADQVAEDYGEHLRGTKLTAEGTPTTLTAQVEGGAPARDERGRLAADELPKDRKKWTKQHWQVYAASIGVGTSGSAKQIADRVKKHEKRVADREAREKAIRDMNRDDLNKAATKTGKIEDPEAYSRAEDLTVAVIAAEFGEDIPAPQAPDSEDDEEVGDTKPDES